MSLCVYASAHRGARFNVRIARRRMLPHSVSSSLELDSGALDARYTSTKAQFDANWIQNNNSNSHSKTDAKKFTFVPSSVKL